LALVRQCSNRIVVIKSTIPPGTTERLNKECEHIQLVFNPEFLTEANFIEDFKNQDRIIIGGPRPASTKVRQLFYKAFPNARIIKTSSTIAEMVKYMTNTFLATKVSFANEMYQICDMLGIDYDKVVEYATHDERLGKSHWSVPGPDGHYGFGGSCFPKDINALIKVAEKWDIPSNVISAAWETNLDVRPEEDWKELKGRAVVDE
jgi:UDPglucose 6-dehydrogenase